MKFAILFCHVDVMKIIYVWKCSLIDLSLALHENCDAKLFCENKFEHSIKMSHWNMKNKTFQYYSSYDY